MLTLFILLFVVACGYGAYRAFRGGFERPQTERWTLYGVIGAVVLVMIAVSVVTHLFG